MSRLTCRHESPPATTQTPTRDIFPDTEQSQSASSSGGPTPQVQIRSDHIGSAPEATALSTTAPNIRRMIAQDRAVLLFRGPRRRGHSPFKGSAKQQHGAGQARADEYWKQSC